jgi:carboxypeptidase T
MNTTTARRFRRSVLLGTAVLVSGLILIPSALASDTAHQTLVTDQGPAAMADFHTVETLERDLLQLAVLHPQIAKLHVIGRSVENRPIWALQLGQSRDKPLEKMLVLGGHHAAEWISVEVPYLLAEHLVTHATDPDVQQLFKKGEIWIIPLVNPDGHKYVETTRLPWRKNRHPNPDGSIGVDLNRNYGYMWGVRDDKDTSCDPKHSRYRGPHAFSEPETQAVRKLMDEQQFAGLLTYHSAAQRILFPWGAHGSDPDTDPDYRVMEGLAKKMEDEINKVNGGGEYKYIAMQSFNFIPTAGDTTDWAYATYHIPAFTIELRPQTTDLSLLPARHITPAWQENWPAAREFIGHVFDKPALLHGNNAVILPVICNSGNGHESPRPASPPSPDPGPRDP